MHDDNQHDVDAITGPVLHGPRPKSHEGYRDTSGDGTGGTHWVVIPRCVVELYGDTNRELHDGAIDIAAHEHEFTHSANCNGPGGTFTWAPEVRIGRTRVLVTQYTGRDV